MSGGHANFVGEMSGGHANFVGEMSEVTDVPI